MQPLGNDVYGQIFAGALAILAILLAVIVVIVPAYQNVASDVTLSTRLGLVVHGTAVLSVIAGLAALGSLTRMLGCKWPSWLIILTAYLLIIGSVVVTIALVAVL